MRRILDLLAQWLPLLAGVSGVVLPAGQMVGDGAASRPAAPPGLDAQLCEILDYVGLEERRWRLKPRSARGPG